MVKEIKTDEPFSIEVKGKSYSGHLHFPKLAQYPTRMEVFANEKRIGNVTRGYSGNWKIDLSDKGLEMFPELNNLQKYELDFMAASLGEIIECNWNCPYWAVRKKP